MKTADASAAPPRRQGRARLQLNDELNFLLTNRVPRIALTRAMGWFSRIQSPWLARLAIAVWRQFTELDLSDARETRFTSLHACFTRALVPGARPVDPDPEVLASPSDGIVVACGALQGTTLIQAKGLTYRLDELLGSAAAAAPYRDGCWVTVRLSSAMYHRFHAPHDGRLEQVTHIGGDTWNVNPPALARIERLYCRNERAVLRYRLADAAGGATLLLVPVAAILVAGIRLHALGGRLHRGGRGPREMPCDAAYRKGDELGWFEHGSTIVVLAPPGFTLAPGIGTGVQLRMGQALLRRPSTARHAGAAASAA